VPSLSVERFRDGLIVIHQVDGHHVYLRTADAPEFIRRLLEISNSYIVPGWPYGYAEWADQIRVHATGAHKEKKDDGE
jgi:hypothetical protein